MISYLQGKVLFIEKDSLTLLVNNVGYQVITTLPYSYKIDQELALYIYTHVKEDQFTLFGFTSLALKETFIKLIQVKGVGPKTGISILTSIEYQKLTLAIDENDVNTIKKIPGIGPKTASQIILDLKGKLIVDSKLVNQELNDALEALLALGYKNTDIKKISELLKDRKLTTQQYVKEGLSILMK